MSVVSDPARVAYVVSGDLVRYADLLPSNKGRSSLVHSLAYHLDLLDLSALEQDDNGDATSRSERSKLLASLQVDAAHVSADSKDRNRARVYLPHAASHQQLLSYHEASFVEQLAKGANAGNLERPNKRQRTHSRSLSPRMTSSVSSGSDSEASIASHSSEELHLRPSNAVAGPSRQRGYKRPHAAKNQFGLQDDCPAFDGLHRHISLVAGASITAAELLATGQADVAIAWDGGRHHAKKDSASGFCYINDVVLAILALRKPRKVIVTTTVPRQGEERGMDVVRKTTIKRVDRVMYLDLDLHWGDGVEEAFHTSPNVLTLSIHHYAPGFFPCYAAAADAARFGPPGSLHGDAGAGHNTLNIPLGLGTSDASLERVLESTVQPLAELWDPEMVVVQCGVDGLAGDPMAVWNLSASAYVAAIERVLRWKKPTLLLGGGGYHSENAARCWSLITAACLGRSQNDTQARRATKPTQDEPTPLTHLKDPADKKSATSLHAIGPDTPIPDHNFWPNYAPEYTLDVPAGERIDQNDEPHFEAIHKTFLEHTKHIASTPRQSK